jgi:hypothetical protein
MHPSRALPLEDPTCELAMEPYLVGRNGRAVADAECLINAGATALVFCVDCFDAYKLLYAGAQARGANEAVRLF